MNTHEEKTPSYGKEVLSLVHSCKCYLVISAPNGVLTIKITLVSYETFAI